MRWFSSVLYSIAIIAMQPAVGDVAAMAADCDGCHGPDGVSQHSDMPTIAGISAFVHAEALFAYMDKARPCATSKYLHGDTSRAATDMCAVVEAMTEEKIEAIAEYYAGKPFVAAKQQTDPALVASGKEIHDRDCEKCHSDGGGNPDDEASIMAGQQMGYLRTSFAEFAAGQRAQPKSMKNKLDKLGEQEIEALVHFYASQQ